MRTVKPSGDFLVKVVTGGHEATAKVSDVMKSAGAAQVASSSNAPQIMLRTAIGQFARDLEAGGVTLNGGGDDGPGWASAIAKAEFSGKRVKLTMPDEIAGSDSKINNTVAVNASFTSIDFGDITFRADGIASGAAVKITGTENPPYKQNLSKIRGFQIIGSGKDNANMQGILLDGGAVAGPSRCVLEDFSITACGDGVLHKNSSYAELISNANVYQCGNGVRFYGAAANAGELPTYFKAKIFQNYIGVNSEGSHGTWMQFTNSNLDHNDRQVSVVGKSKVKLLHAHVENFDETDALFYITGDGSTFIMEGGELVITNETNRTLPYVVDCTANQGFGGAYFNMVDFYKVWTTSGYFSTGAGITEVNGFTTISDRRHCTLLNANFNRLVDGGFEMASLSDTIQIYKDTAAITSRFTGSNIALTQGAASPYAGSKYLQSAKAGAAGTSAGYFIVVPLTNMRQRGGFRGMFRKSASGSATIQFVYARLAPSTSAGVMSLIQTGGSAPSVTFSDTSGNWIEVNSQDYGIKPAMAFPWATHFGAFVDQTNQGAGNLDSDFNQIALM